MAHVEPARSSLALQSLGALLALLALPAPASAQYRDPDWAQEWAINGLLLSGWLVADLFKEDLAPRTCRWCDTEDGRWRPPAPDRIARDSLLASSPSAAATASDILAYVVLPGAALGVDALSREGDWRGAASDATLISRGVASALMLNQVVKFSVGRARPYTHVSPEPFADNPDQNLSFYSGHTSLAFSTVMSTGLVLSRRDSPYAPWVFGIGLPAAAAVGALRIAADKHYLTDVVTGAAAGVLMSWVAVCLLPYSDE